MKNLKAYREFTADKATAFMLAQSDYVLRAITVRKQSDIDVIRTIASDAAHFGLMLLEPGIVRRHIESAISMDEVVLPS